MVYLYIQQLIQYYFLFLLKKDFLKKMYSIDFCLCISVFIRDYIRKIKLIIKKKIIFSGKLFFWPGLIIIQKKNR